MFQKSLLIDAWNVAFSVEFNRRDLKAFADLLETDNYVRADTVRLQTGLRQSGRQRHRKAAGMRRADQFFRIRARAFFKPRREGILSFKSAAA